MDLSELERFNTWWKIGKVRQSLTKEYKRIVYNQIMKHIDKRLIILLYGLRRMGKTTIMYQIISELLEHTEGKNILYFSFDEYAYSIDDVLNEYQNSVLHKTFDNTEKNVYIFLDEIQKLQRWEDKIKIYYDLYPNLKFILSESASVSLRKKSDESLAGRIITIAVEPLNFTEFLEMNGLNVIKIKENPDLYKRDIMPLLDRYMKYGTFPELSRNEDDDYARLYIRETVIDRIIYKDIEREFRVNDVELLKNLIKMISNRPGMTLNFKAISENIGRDQRTISNYFEYLEFGLLVKIIYNYRENEFISLRKLKKCYPVTPNIVFALSDKFNELMPYIMENLVLMNIRTNYFYKNNYEIDFISVKKDKIMPVAVKKTDRTEKQLKLFIKKYGNKVENPLMVTYDNESNDNITVIPLWKFLLEF
ncbi:ATP-binding protein [Ferroplasma sp.]|uniref:ATP-binding protein n=1 Tax=Ferroplasma sp. TaxID=2591003 RepID=UPI0026050CBF|nr:ATP-binding protein [Ferroplasma sp.]